MKKRTILTITGSDSIGESGIQADIKTISELGGYAACAITSITIQNTLGIQEFFDIPASIVEKQIEAIVNDIQPAIIKIGLIRSNEILEVIVNILLKYKPLYVIYDPTTTSSKGEILINVDTSHLIQEELFPLCSLIINRKNKRHGENNTYSSAIAAYLSEGYDLKIAQEKANEYINSLTIKKYDLKGRSVLLYNRFLNELEKQIKTNNDVNYFSNKLNVSSRYLAQVTKRVVGKNPKTIIDEKMINQIKISLRTTNKSIQEIAIYYCFSSQSHLTKYFKKITGETPSKFRENE